MKFEWVGRGTDTPHLRLRQPARALKRKQARSRHPLQMLWIVRSPAELDAMPLCLQISRLALDTQASRSIAKLWWPLVVCRRGGAFWRVGQAVARAAGPGRPEAGDGGEKAFTAAAGEDGKGGDQRVVARDERGMVLWIARIAPPSAGEQPVTCHPAKALTDLASWTGVFGVPHILSSSGSLKQSSPCKILSPRAGTHESVLRL